VVQKHEAGEAISGDIAMLKVPASETLEFCAREVMQIPGGYPMAFFLFGAFFDFSLPSLTH